MGLQNHIFIDDAHLVKNLNEELIAFITLGRDYIHYTLMNKDKNQLYFVKSIHKPDGDIGQPEFDSLLVDSLLRNAAEVNIAIDTAKQVLLPTHLLSNENLSIYFKHIHDIEKDEELLKQDVNAEITELYVVKKQTIAYLKNVFKSVSLYSHSAGLITSYTKLSHYSTKADSVYVHTAHETFHLTFFKKGKLHYYQSFDLMAASDILYCLLNVMQWQQIEMNDLKLYLTGFSLLQNDIAALLADYFSVDTIDENSMGKQTIFLSHFPLRILYHQYSLIACVS